jgi:hypothetical protein
MAAHPEDPELAAHPEDPELVAHPEDPELPRFPEQTPLPGWFRWAGIAAVVVVVAAGGGEYIRRNIGPGTFSAIHPNWTASGGMGLLRLLPDGTFVKDPWNGLGTWKVVNGILHLNWNEYGRELFKWSILKGAFAYIGK